jgi:hypothetical protein
MPEELFIVEKYTGFNRFRGKYRTAHSPFQRSVDASDLPSEGRRESAA